MSPGCSSGDLGFTASRRSLDLSERVKGLECGVQGLPVCNDSFRCFETPLVIIMYSLSEFASRQPRGIGQDYIKWGLMGDQDKPERST